MGKIRQLGKVTIVHDMDRAVSLMKHAGRWLISSGKPISKWWHPDNLNKEFLLQYVSPDEWYVALVDGVPAGAAAFQFSQKSQDWAVVDGDNPKPALYVHWLCVSRAFAGRGMPRALIDFAAQKAKDQGVSLLRVDTNAEEEKLCRIYESLGFVKEAVTDEGYRKSALYQKQL